MDNARLSTVLRQLDYHAWANQRMLDAVAPLTEEQLHRDLKNSFPSIWRTLEHIYQADECWYARHQGNVIITVDMFKAEPSLDLFRTQWAGVHRRFRAFAEALTEADLDRTIDYRLLSGLACRTNIYDNLLHVANHGTYHRGQVVTMLRQLGAKGVSTDLIAYIRQL